MKAFYLFFYHPKLKDLLLEEIKLKHPELLLSFSNKEFVSMKGPDNYEAQLIERPVAFARRQAKFVDKSSKASLDGEYIKIGESQYWNFNTIMTPMDTFNLTESEISEEVPARAYHKACQAFRLFKEEITADDQVVEIGSAPGGISYYVLEKGAKLVAVDPALMSPIIESKFGEQFSHIKKSVFDVTRAQLPKHCDWLISDLNLNGDLNTNQSRRIMDFYKNIKGAFLTIKTPVINDLKKINEWIEVFTADKKYEVSVCHLPSHRREIGMFIRPRK